MQARIHDVKGEGRRGGVGKGLASVLQSSIIARESALDRHARAERESVSRTTCQVRHEAPCSTSFRLVVCSQGGCSVCTECACAVPTHIVGK